MKVHKSSHRELYGVMMKPKNYKEMQALLSDLLTPSELKSATDRLKILKMLLAGVDQRTIAKKLNTSIGKVTRGSQVIQFGNADWDSLLE